MEFHRLNAELKDMLEKLEPYQFDEDFMFDLEENAQSLFHMHPMQVTNDIRELEHAGYVRVYRGDNFTKMHFAITSDGRCYKKLLRRHILETCFYWIGNLIIGASGGAIALMLASLIG